MEKTVNRQKEDFQMKEMIVYFSRNGENYVNGSIRDLPVGNTQVAAGMIHDLTGAPMFKLEPEVPYAFDYNTCIDEAKADQRRDARPELKEYPDTLDGVDKIYLGYPNYWGTMPMAVFTFLEKYDFSGKVIKPFCTHEGSGMGSSERDIRKLCPKARVEKSLPIHGADVKGAENLIKGWL